jgi:hypothetical protein
MVLLGSFTAEFKAWSCLVHLPLICHGVCLYAHLALIWDLETFFSGIWQIWAICFMENPLYRLKLYFSGRNLAKFCQNKNTGLEGRLYQNWTSFGEDSFYHFILWQISFNFAKCF